jgi:hypothetical protein
MSEPNVEVISDSVAGRIGKNDWISLGDSGTRHRTGPLRHVGECVVVRDHGRDFPALLLIYGTEAELGAHKLSATRPVTVSLDGFSGGLVSTRPDTRIELQSPAIRPSDRFVLDGQLILQAQPGRLEFTLAAPGVHTLRHTKITK